MNKFKKIIKVMTDTEFEKNEEKFDAILSSWVGSILVNGK